MIIGIGHKKGQGKDEVAKILKYFFYCEEICAIPKFRYYKKYFLDENVTPKSNAVTVGFADKIKDIVSLILNCRRELLDDRDFKEMSLGYTWSKWYAEEGISVRSLIQNIGESLRNNIHNDIWVNCLFNSVDEREDIIIPDVRRINEVEEIRFRDGVLIKVERPGFKDTGDHISETDLDNYENWDEIIINDKDIENLYNKVEHVITKYKTIVKDEE